MCEAIQGELDFVPSADPRAGYFSHKAEIDAAVKLVFEGGRYILGSEATSFEREFADYHGIKHALGVGSGTDALELALRIGGIGPGDTVITVSHTAVATVAAIELAGAEPLLVEVDSQSYTMCPFHLEDTLKRSTGRRIRAVIPVHLYGHPADMGAINEIAKRYDLLVVEDCAQAHGAALDNQLIGTFGDLAAFSFYPTKNLGAFGDGGALLTNNSRFAERGLLLREYGWRERYVSELRGMNTRLDELQAAILRVKLRYLSANNERRQCLAGIYDRQADKVLLTLPTTRHGATHVYHQYVVRSANRDALREHLRNKRIGSSILYPMPVHLQPAYRGRTQIGDGGLHFTEKLCGEILSLPLFPELSETAVARVCSEITPVS